MEAMFMQNFGGKTKSIMVFLKVSYNCGFFQSDLLFALATCMICSE